MTVDSTGVAVDGLVCSQDIPPQVPRVHHQERAGTCRVLYLWLTLEAEQLQAFVSAILAEILLCTKEVKEKARVAAFDLLATIGETAGSAAEEGQEGLSIEKLVTSVAAGLAGKTAHMISATVLALAKLFYQVLSNGRVSSFLTRSSERKSPPACSGQSLTLSSLCLAHASARSSRAALASSRCWPTPPFFFIVVVANLYGI